MDNFILIMAIENISKNNVVDQNVVYAGSMTIRPEPCGLSAARRQISRVASDLHFSEEDIACFILAVGEAISNAYRHGTPDVRSNYIYLGWRFADDILTVTIKDEGMGFSQDDCNLDENCYRLTSGFGINLMHANMDSVHFEFDDGAKIILEKRWIAGGEIRKAIEMVNELDN